MVSASPGVESGSCTKLKTKAERLERLNGGLSARKLFCCERLLTRQGNQARRRQEGVAFSCLNSSIAWFTADAVRSDKLIMFRSRRWSIVVQRFRILSLRLGLCNRGTTAEASLAAAPNGKIP
jgi:hypothetical protein